MNWIILTKIFRGMSLGTTLRLPLGKRVEVIDVRRLREQKETEILDVLNKSMQIYLLKLQKI